MKTRPHLMAMIFRLCFFVTLIVLIALLSLSACTTNHYFSVNAEEMTNPKIEYRDSTNLQNPF